MMQDALAFINLLVLYDLFHESAQRDIQSIAVLPSEACGEIPLRVSIDEKHFFSLPRKTYPQIHRSSCLAYAAFLIAHSDHFTLLHGSPPCCPSQT